MYSDGLLLLFPYVPFLLVLRQIATLCVDLGLIRKSMSSYYRVWAHTLEERVRGRMEQMG